MAKRRMFSLDIVDTDAFLEMPPTSQNLYFHLGMRADDDGFISNPNKIMKVVGAQTDDMKILLAKRFVIGFENGIIVIKHWKINNYIASDRYHETCYTDEKMKLITKDNGAYTECIQIVDRMDTQVRLGKARKGKVSQGKIIFECDYFNITETYHETYKQSYPNINLMQSYNQMFAWLKSNPQKRKSNYPRFINNWLARQYKDSKPEKPETPLL
jgi:hypothetical protein